MWPSNLPGRSGAHTLSKRWCRRDPGGKIAKRVFFLCLSNGAAAITLAQSNNAQVNITTADVTTPEFNILAGNATVVPSSSTIHTTNTVPTSSTASATAGPPSNRTPIQLIVANSCGETIWPGIVTQSGTGPGTGGFELTPGTSRMMFVSGDWEGRVWGRTNCSFNSDGSGPSTSSGVNGYGAACLTGDCFGRLDCQFAVSPPFYP